MTAGAPLCSCGAVDLLESQERQLAGACARGDEVAWLELIRRYDRSVLRVLWQSGAREDADDLLQEVWVRLLARDGIALRSFRAGRSGALRVFLAKVAKSVAIDHGRSRRLRPPAAGGEEPGELAHAGPGPEAVVSAEREKHRLAAAILQAALEGENPARDRDILRLHFEEGHLPLEIASMGLGLAARGVEALLRRAKARIEEILKEEEP
jgi:RNA polymerase sigma factor (sigma-70 family)